MSGHKEKNGGRSDAVEARRQAATCLLAAAFPPIEARQLARVRQIKKRGGAARAQAHNRIFLLFPFSSCSFVHLVRQVTTIAPPTWYTKKRKKEIVHLRFLEVENAYFGRNSESKINVFLCVLIDLIVLGQVKE